MESNFLTWLSLIGSVLSIISFFPIMGATFIWCWKRTKKRILLKDKDGHEFEVKVRRKYLNNKDLTPLVQKLYDGDVNVAKPVRQSILDATLDVKHNIEHIDSSRKIDDIKVS